jgi:hypothetical protein
MNSGVIRAVVAALSFATAALAATLQVPGQYATVQAALDAAGKNDTIVVAPGDYVLAAPLDFNRRHDPDDPGSPAVRDVVVKSDAGPEATVLRLDAAVQGPRASVVAFTKGETFRSVLEGFTVTGGKGSDDGTGVMQGGGVLCDRSAPTLQACILKGNAANAGGGLYCGKEAVPLLVNCVIAGNAAAQGGGVFAWSSARLVMENCTVAGNTVDGFFCAMDCVPGPNPDEYTCYGPFAALTNCILWGNRGASIGMDGGTGPRAANSLVGGDDVWPGKDNLNADPLFVQAGVWDDRGTPADLADDAWTEGDLHLQAASPCIDKGVSADMATTDVEGYARPCGGGVDMGAYESGQCAVMALHFLRGDANGDGKIDISDAVHTLSFLFAHGPSAGCRDSADTNDDGRIDIGDAVAVLGYLFGGSGPLAAPFEICGLDPTIDGLSCERYQPCQ